MGKVVNSRKLRNIMTLATDLRYTFFHNTVFYKGYYCLSSVAVVKEDIPQFNLCKGQLVLTSPMIDNNEIGDTCIVYKTIHIDPESGLFIPILSWALEFTKHIIMLDLPVFMEKCNRLVENLLMKVWEYKEVNVSRNGLNINLLSSSSWGAISNEKMIWDDHDSFLYVEDLLKSGTIELDSDILPHAHTENICYFCEEDVCRGLIIDW